MNLFNLLYNSQAEKDIQRLIANAIERGYDVRRRNSLRRWLGGGYSSIPPFVNPPNGKKGVLEVSKIYAAIHELDPKGGHLGQFERLGTNFYRGLIQCEIEASLTALKAFPRYGVLTDPIGLFNIIMNLPYFASGLGQLVHRLSYRDKYALLENERKLQ